MLRSKIAPFALPFALLVGACSDASSGRSTRSEVAARIACASAPAEALVRTVVGDAVPIALPVPIEIDPTHWTPTRDAVQELQDARRLVLAGAGLEAWATQASLPQSRVVDAAAGMEDRFIQLPVMKHTHGDGEEHTHEGVDAHVWFDPDVLRHQLERVFDEVTEAFEDARPTLEERRRGWRAADDAYRARLADVKERLGGRKLLAAWPCYGYLARSLDARITTASLDPWAADGGRSVAGMRTLEDHAEGSAGILLWPAEPPAALAEELRAALGLESIVVDALLRPDGSQDVYSRLTAGLERINAALGQQ